MKTFDDVTSEMKHTTRRAENTSPFSVCFARFVQGKHAFITQATHITGSWPLYVRALTMKPSHPDTAVSNAPVWVAVGRQNCK